MGLLANNLKEKTNFAAINDALTLDVETSNVARVEFSGTYAFTAVFETSVDGVNWFPSLGTMTDAATTALSHSTANATKAYTVDVRGAAKVRARLSAFTSAAAHRVAIAAS